MCWKTFDNHIPVEDHGFPGDPGCKSLRTRRVEVVSQPLGAPHIFFYLAGATVITPLATTALQEGHHIEICAIPFRWMGAWTPEVYDCGGGTTIDRSTPILTLDLANGVAGTSSATIPLTIHYEDETSPPWSGKDGGAANWVCVALNQDCTPATISPDCSQPTLHEKRDVFTCELTVSSSGSYHVCAKGADSAVPDTGGADQFYYADPTRANISAVSCDTVNVRLVNVRSAGGESSPRSAPPSASPTGRSENSRPRSPRSSPYSAPATA